MSTEIGQNSSVSPVWTSAKPFPYINLAFYLNTRWPKLPTRRAQIISQLVIRGQRNFIINPWINPPRGTGYGAEGLFSYFANIYGFDHDGSSPASYLEKDVLDGEFAATQRYYAASPYEIDFSRPSYVEKAYIYYAEKITEKTDVIGGEYVLFYQR